MSIWGKVLGGVGGFALGGPLGALIGAVAGHAVDRLRGSGDETHSARKQVAFTIAVIALGAKMAKADGRVTREEIDAFKQAFRIPPEEMKNVGRVFNQARRDVAGFEAYAQQIAGLFHNNPARADGRVTDDELAYLRTIASIFGFNEAEWDRIRAANLPATESDPFNILGVERSASNEAIKAAHRHLVKENHPDRLVAQGMPAEFVELANDKLARINAAYDEIRLLRGIA
jgi:DnaJ like chaperone protein